MDPTKPEDETPPPAAEAEPAPAPEPGPRRRRRRRGLEEKAAQEAEWAKDPAVAEAVALEDAERMKREEDRPKAVNSTKKRTKPATIPLEAMRAYKKARREERIEAIASLMRQFVTPAGAPTWNRKVRKALGASWNLPDYMMRKLAAIASKRVCKEVTDKKTLKRNVGVMVDSGMRETFLKKDWKYVVQFATLGWKMAEGTPAADVTVKVETVTPAMAARAVQEMFGDKAAKTADEATADAGDQTEAGKPADGSPEGPSEE